MRKIKYGVTHGGRAHPDDMMAWSRILFSYPHLELQRRDPIDMELEDPEVIVFDVGGKHEPDKLNFDHHNTNFDVCSFEMIVEHFDGSEFYSWALEQEWMKYIRGRDLHTGKYEEGFTLRHLMGLFIGNEKEVFRTFMNSWWDTQYYKYRRVDENVIELVSQMCASGDIREVEFCNTTISVIGVRHPRLSQIRGRMEELWRVEGEGPQLSISPDDRGDGWMIYRRRGHIDLYKLANTPEVSWADDRGFIAKTTDLMPLHKLLGIVRKIL